MSLKYQVKFELYQNTEFKLQIYYRHGISHRLTAPAKIITNCYMYWYEYGKYHRIGGPARIRNEPYTTHYFIRGVEYTNENYDFKMRSD